MIFEYAKYVFLYLLIGSVLEGAIYADGEIWNWKCWITIVFWPLNISMLCGKVVNKLLSGF